MNLPLLTLSVLFLTVFSIKSPRILPHYINSNARFKPLNLPKNPKSTPHLSNIITRVSQERFSFLHIPLHLHLSNSAERVSERQADGSGLTGDLCTTSSDCISPRECVQPSEDGEAFVECSIGSTCICLPPSLDTCQSSDECVDGEICTALESGSQVCVSEVFADSNGLEEVGGTGLTGSTCSENSECKPPRLCRQSSGECTAGSSCLCFPSSLESCSTSDDCVEGEVCALDTSDNSQFCIIPEAVEAVDDWKEVDDGSGGGPTEAPPTTNTGGSGLTGTHCTNVNQCLPPRNCVQTNGEECVAGESCICFPVSPVMCESSDECLEGEVCTIMGGNLQLCVSKEIVDGADGLEEIGNEETGGDGGLTGTLCTDDDECASPRECLQPSAEECEAGATCFCRPAILDGCESSDDCVAGEVCAVQVSDGLQFCATPEFVANVDGIEEVGGEPTTAPPTTGTGGNGLTGTECIRNEDCLSPRTCEGGTPEECRSSLSCICIPEELVSCTSSEDCVEGEVCAVLVDSPICVAKEFADENGLELVGGPSSSTEEELETPGPSPADSDEVGRGLTGSPCRDDSECISPRACGIFGDCDTPGSCFCLPDVLQDCESSEDCVEGEVCVREFSGSQFCVVEGFSNQVDGLEELRKLRIRFLSRRWYGRMVRKKATVVVNGAAEGRSSKKIEVKISKHFREYMKMKKNFSIDRALLRRKK